MPVEFIGMIGTKNESEIRLTAGPVIDPDYVRRFARAHEDAGFDRVLIGYSSTRPDGTQVAAYAAAHTERLSFLVAHRPGFVAPTLAARTFATLDQFTGGRIAVHIITGGSDAEQRRDGDHLSKDERYDRTDEYLDILKQAWTSEKPFSYQGSHYQIEDFYSEVRSPQQPRIRLYFGGSSAAAYRVGGKHADTYALWGEPLAETKEQIDSVNAAAKAAGRTDTPGISVSFRPILGPTEELAWERAHAHPADDQGERGRLQGPPAPRDLGARRQPAAQRRLPAAARRRREGRAARPGAVDPARRRHRRRRQLDRAGRHAGDGRPGDPRLHRHRRHHHPHPGLRPLQRRHRLRPPPAPAGPRRGRPERRGKSPGRRRRRPPAGGAGMTARQRQLKLGAVTMGAGGPGQHYLWLDPEIPGDASVNVDWYIEQARLAEAAKFDLVFIVDSQFITPDSPPHYLNRLEPITLLSALAVTTRHLGLVATMTTSYNDPFNVARRLASLDLISGGRSGWNVVTSGDAGAAANFSRDEHFDYDTRYARGLEFVRVAQGLWDSYEADAFPRDRATRTFLDPTRQHQLNHRGEHFQVAGPLNVSRSPQGQPVIFQAGDSEQGRDLGATIGEGIFTHAASLEQGQAFYADIKSRAAAKGRDPDHLVVMPGMRVYVGDTDADAREIERDLQLAAQDFDKALAELGRPFAWHDFRQYDLDAPFPQEALKYAERGFRTNAENIAKLARDRDLTLRQTVESISSPKPTPFAGAPATVADQITRWFDARALDGVNYHIANPAQWRRFREEVVPILQERGVVRSEYDSTTLRGNLGLPVPDNRHTAARQQASLQKI